MRSEHLLPQPIDQRFEQIGHTPGPVGERRNRNARARAGVALVQPVQWRVVDVLAHHHVGQDRSIRDAALENPLRSRGGDDSVAAVRASVLGQPVLVVHEVPRDPLDAAGDLLADLLPRLATLSTAALVVAQPGLVHLALGAGQAQPTLALLARDLLGRFPAGVLHRLDLLVHRGVVAILGRSVHHGRCVALALQLLKEQRELGRVHPFRVLPQPVPPQLRDQKLQLTALLQYRVHRREHQLEGLVDLVLA
jgi:hypothetical protein